MKTYKAEIKLKGIGDFVVINDFRCEIKELKKINLSDQVLYHFPSGSYIFSPGTILYIKLTEVKE